MGVNPGDARSIRVYQVLSGKFLEEQDKESAVISQTLADMLGVEVGDEFQIPSVNGLVSLRVSGILPPDLGTGNEKVLVTLGEAQQLTDLPGKINAIELNLDSTDPVRHDEILTGLKAALGRDYKVGSLLSGPEIFSTVRMAEQMINLFGVLALFTGAFIIFNTFRTIIVERRRDIGMLRALGATRRMITGMILLEGLLQGAAGTAAGLLLGYLLGAGVLRLASPLMGQFINLKIGAPIISPSILTASILLGLSVTVLSGILPAFNANRITPLEALRPSLAEVEFNRQGGTGLVIGLVFISLSLLALFSRGSGYIGIGCFLFLLGLMFAAQGLVNPIVRMSGWVLARLIRQNGVDRLAQGNLVRQSSRTAITASASMFGLAVIVAAGSLVASIILPIQDILIKGLGSDYLLLPPSITLWNSDLGASPELAQRLHEIDGVSEISTLRYASTVVNGQIVTLMGIDPSAFPEVSGLRFQQNTYLTESAAYQALAAQRTLIVNGLFLAQTGTQVGEAVTLATPEGSQEYRIVAAGADLFNAKVPAAYLSQIHLEQDFSRTEDVLLQIKLNTGTDRELTETAIRSVARDYPQFKVIDGKTYIASLMSMMNAGFAGMYLMLALLALPSLIAMLNTLAIGVIERTREIGMLRAVGCTRKQIRQMILSEALILAALGTVLGISAGIYLGYLFISALGNIFPLGYAFPVAGVIAAIAFSLVFGALAAVIPSRQAARLPIVEALRYE